MQIITLSGTVLGDSEVKIDKCGHKYVRFKVLCRYSAQGKEKTALYRCYSFDTAHSNLKDGARVFVSGDVEMNVRLDDNGKAWINCDVYVRHLDCPKS